MLLITRAALLVERRCKWAEPSQTKASARYMEAYAAPHRQRTVAFYPTASHCGSAFNLTGSARSDQSWFNERISVQQTSCIVCDCGMLLEVWRLAKKLQRRHNLRNASLQVLGSSVQSGQNSLPGTTRVEAWLADPFARQFAAERSQHHE